MSNHRNRLEKLEQIHRPSEKIYVVYYDDQGRAIEGSAPELIGKTREEIGEMIETDRSVITLTVVWLPDNGRNRV